MRLRGGRRGQRHAAMRDGVDVRDPAVPRWRAQRERGSPALMDFVVGVALRMGRPAARRCCRSSAPTSWSSRGMRAARRATTCTRVLGRPARWRDMYRQFRCFATTILDRVLWLAGRSGEYDDPDVAASMRIDDARRAGRGCFLFGAHYGSFELLRVLATTRPDMCVRALMHPHNDRKLAGVLERRATVRTDPIIELGRPETMLEVRDALAPGRARRDARRSLAHRRRHAAVRFPRRAGALPARSVQARRGARRAGRAVPRDLAGRPALRRRVRARSATCARPRARTWIRRARATRPGSRPRAARSPENWFNFYDFWAGAADRGERGRRGCEGGAIDRDRRRARDSAGRLAAQRRSTWPTSPATLGAVEESRVRFTDVRTIAALGTPIERAARSPTRGPAGSRWWSRRRSPSG